MPRRAVPAYCHHKATGQAYVKLAGKRHYLGAYGSPESKNLYAQRISEWQADQDEGPDQLKLRELTMLYTKHAEAYYVKDGRQTTEVQTIRDALKRLNKVHRDVDAANYSPKMLKSLQRSMIGEGLARTTINGTIARIRRMFRWAVSEELVKVETIIRLETAKDLRSGRSDAREPKPIVPVNEADINATLKHVSKPVADMIRLQLLSGCRPSEIVGLRPCDVNRDGDVWEYVPASHKTQHHGRERRIYFGPRAQVILDPYLDNRPAEAHCFSPIEAEAQRRAKQREDRKTPVQPSQVKRQQERLQDACKRRRRPKEAYTVASYRRAIARGCKDAKIDPWAPNQLRHSRATDLRRMYGVEAAKTVCGHSKIETTLIYAEADFAKAKAIMAEIG